MCWHIEWVVRNIMHNLQNDVRQQEKEGEERDKMSQEEQYTRTLLQKEAQEARRRHHHQQEETLLLDEEEDSVESVSFRTPSYGKVIVGGSIRKIHHEKNGEMLISAQEQQHKGRSTLLEDESEDDEENENIEQGPSQTRIFEQEVAQLAQETQNKGRKETLRKRPAIIAAMNGAFVESNGWFEVEAILGRREVPELNRIEYLVKWKGCQHRYCAYIVFN
jgi:hypothetical protein